MSNKHKHEEHEVKEEVKKKKDCGCDPDCTCTCNHEDEKEKHEEKITEEQVVDDIEKMKAEVEDWKQAYMRKQAEFQNFTKRKEKEMEELRKFASEKIIVKLLEGLDNLERAVVASEETKDFDALVKGVNMILTQFKGIMESEGVESIKADGEYDPIYHHAVIVEDNPEFQDNHIILELQKGYTMKGKVVRPTMVKVCKKG